MITVRTEMSAARHLLRLGQIKDKEHLVFLQPTLHVNLNHPIITSLVRLHKTNPKTAQLVVEQVCLIHCMRRNCLSIFYINVLPF